MNILAQISQAKNRLIPVLKNANFNDVVNIMSNRSRNQWARAGYPGLNRKDINGPAEFVSPPLLLRKLQELTRQRMRKLLQPKRKV